MKRTSSQNITKLALAGSLVAGASTAAQAAIVVFNDGAPTTLSSSSGNNTLTFNLATGQVGQNGTAAGAQFQITYDGGNTGKIRLGGIAGTNGAVLYTSNGTDVINNAFGTPISASSGTFAGSGTQPYLSFNQDTNSQFRYGVQGFAGLAFSDPNTGNTDFGYASVTVNADNSVTLGRFAYENTGAAIPAGAVPEPSSVALTLLASGAAGALLVRRRRQARLLAA